MEINKIIWISELKSTIGIYICLQFYILLENFSHVNELDTTDRTNYMSIKR